MTGGTPQIDADWTACDHAKTETLPTDACQWFYECEQCHTVLRPKPGDCCVYLLRHRAAPADPGARQGQLLRLIGQIADARTARPIVVG